MAMCRAFQTAEASSALETTSVLRPSAARWLLTSCSVCEARSERTVPQSEPGVQSPASVVASARGVTTPAVSAAAPSADARSAVSAHVSGLCKRARDVFGDVGGGASIQ
jgi:hypothetical protein